VRILRLAGAAALVVTIAAVWVLLMLAISR
jgi:hypothetical protein